MRRVEGVLLFILLAAVLFHQAYLAHSVLEVDDPGLDRDTMAPPELWDPGVDPIEENDTESNHDDHIFWMNDGWYYKKFDRFGNELIIEGRTDNGSYGQTGSEEPVDIDSNQDIHFVWVPGGYSGDVDYVVYDEKGSLVIGDAHSGVSGDGSGQDTVDSSISNKEKMKSWWFI